jgi:HlyD family secretion protein
MVAHEYPSRLSGLILIGAILLSACGLQGAGTPTATPPGKEASPVVSATGKVVPAEWATLSMNVSGVAADVPVKEGERVQRGQLLVRLSGKERLEAQVTTAELAILQAQQDLKLLNDNHQQDLAAAQLRLAEANKALDQAKKRRLSPSVHYGNKNQIDIAYANLVLARNEVERIEDLFSLVQDRPDDDSERASVLSQLAVARIARDKALANFNYIVSLPDKLEVGVTDAQLAQAQAAVDSALRDLDKLQKGPDPDKLSLAQTGLKNAEDLLKAAKAALSDLELRAPIDGTISKIFIRAQESVVAATPVMQIANLSLLRVETTDLSEIDVARIDAGRSVSITFDALPDVVVTGKVTQISPRSAEGSGVNYTVIIEMNEIPAGLRWGMTAFADIQVNN